MTASTEELHRRIVEADGEIHASLERLKAAIERSQAGESRARATAVRTSASQRRAIATQRRELAPRTSKEREHLADLRDAEADKRESLANQREAEADERERLADRRETEANDWERRVLGHPSADSLVRLGVELRMQTADEAEALAATAESIAAELESAAARGDAERRMRFATSERNVAKVLRYNAAVLRDLAPGPLILEHLPVLPRDEPIPAQPANDSS